MYKAIVNFIGVVFGLLTAYYIPKKIPKLKRFDYLIGGICAGLYVCIILTLSSIFMTL